jgi:uncharacterized RDD family membrane protein YckC
MAGSGFPSISPDCFKSLSNEESYKKYFNSSILVVIILNMVLPTLMGLFVMPFFFKDLLGARYFDMGRGVLLIPEPGAKPVEETEFQGNYPCLLDGGESLLIITSEKAWEYSNRKVTQIEMEPIPAFTTQPFLYKGVPAVLQAKDKGCSLLVLRGRRWIAENEIIVKPDSAEWICDIEKLKVISYENNLHLFFLSQNKTIHYSMIPEYIALKPGQFIIRPESWYLANGISSEWEPFVINGQPGVACLDSASPFSKPLLSFMSIEKNGWVDIGKCQASDISQFCVLPGNAKNQFLIAAQTLPGRVMISRYSDGNLVKIVSSGSGFPFTPQAMTFVYTGNLLIFAISAVAAFVLSKRMEKDQIPIYRIEDKSVILASLWKRSIAKAFDVFLSFIPGAIFQFNLLKGIITGTGADVPIGFSENLALMSKSIALTTLVWIVLSYMEGKFGQTPGKMLMKIKAVRKDNLEPCGFLMSLLRNIALFADGFFQYFVGIALIAGTSYRQRIGDFAAKTIVIDLSEPMCIADTQPEGAQ